MFTVAAPKVSATTADGTLVYVDRVGGELVERVSYLPRIYGFGGS